MAHHRFERAELEESVRAAGGVRAGALLEAVQQVGHAPHGLLFDLPLVNIEPLDHLGGLLEGAGCLFGS